MYALAVNAGCVRFRKEGERKQVAAAVHWRTANAIPHHTSSVDRGLSATRGRLCLYNVYPVNVGCCM